jgi:hypothetical protein
VTPSGSSTNFYCRGHRWITASGLGAAVVLTQNEVNLHRLEHPNNALAVVRNIVLDHNGDRPIATGGDLVLVMPWKIDEAGSSAIVYDYRGVIAFRESRWRLGGKSGAWGRARDV